MGMRRQIFMRKALRSSRRGAKPPVERVDAIEVGAFLAEETSGLRDLRGYRVLTLPIPQQVRKGIRGCAGCL